MNFSNYYLFQKDIIDNHVLKIETLGFSVIDDFFDENTCLELKFHLEKAIDSYSPVDKSERSLMDRFHMHDLLCQNIVFSRTLEDPRLNQLLAPLIGEFWIMYAYTSSSLPPNGQNYGSRIHVDCPRFIPNYISNVGVIWALDEFTEENGATFVLPGSHNSELIPTEDFFKTNSIRLTCKKGSLVVFNARMWHAAGSNNTDKFRHALTLNACRP
jgi:ectoine hydroxylase-related dioxygenase (phytanoyl-CoA dioxygenase family)